MCGLKVLKIRLQGELGVPSTRAGSCGTDPLEHAGFLWKKVLGYLAERMKLFEGGGGGERELHHYLRSSGSRSWLRDPCQFSDVGRRDASCTLL